MRLIVCLDDKNGMLFNHRRQSTDRALRQRMLTLTRDSVLRMSDYSARQFDMEASNIVVDEAFLMNTSEKEFCFAETGDIAQHIDKVSQLIIYRWNRVYPSDTKFPDALLKKGWKTVCRTDFPGHSHEKITEEIYTL